MKKQPKEKWYIDVVQILGFCALVFFIGIIVVGGIKTGEYVFSKIYDSHQEKSPGELVDLAMALPGAIVISPHRDLIEIGIQAEEIDSGGNHTPVYLTSPAIAVHTKKNWCIWELGWKGFFSYDRDFEKKGGHLFFGNITEIGSAYGYQTAYDGFTKCVNDGNDR